MGVPAIDLGRGSPRQEVRLPVLPATSSTLEEHPSQHTFQLDQPLESV